MKLKVLEIIFKFTSGKDTYCVYPKDNKAYITKNGSNIYCFSSISVNITKNEAENLVIEAVNRIKRS